MLSVSIKMSVPQFLITSISDELQGAAQVGMSPFCAAWFLRQHIDLLGEDIVMRRAAGYPALYHPSELTDRVRDICAAC